MLVYVVSDKRIRTIAISLKDWTADGTTFHVPDLPGHDDGPQPELGNITVADLKEPSCRRIALEDHLPCVLQKAAQRLFVQTALADQKVPSPPALLAWSRFPSLWREPWACILDCILDVDATFVQPGRLADINPSASLRLCGRSRCLGLQINDQATTADSEPDQRKFEGCKSGHSEKAKRYDRPDMLILRAFGGTSSTGARSIISQIRKM